MPTPKRPFEVGGSLCHAARIRGAMSTGRGLGHAMGPVAREILGQPNEALSSDRELRFGSRGSLSVDLRKGTWFDHQAGQGGGVLDLLRVKRGMLNGAALAWLEE